MEKALNLRTQGTPHAQPLTLSRAKSMFVFRQRQGWSLHATMQCTLLHHKHLHVAMQYGFACAMMHVAGTSQHACHCFCFRWSIYHLDFVPIFRHAVLCAAVWLLIMPSADARTICDAISFDICHTGNSNHEDVNTNHRIQVKSNQYRIAVSWNFTALLQQSCWHMWQMRNFEAREKQEAVAVFERTEYCLVMSSWTRSFPGTPCCSKSSLVSSLLPKFASMRSPSAFCTTECPSVPKLCKHSANDRLILLCENLLVRLLHTGMLKSKFEHV